MVEDYAAALSLARDAALSAGELLRSEFHRPGGPRGDGAKCPADLRAERLIREKLTSAFPRWGYCGEETGLRSCMDLDSHHWMVDPNDGTSSFVKGRRGSSVSIALLRHGLPVLGVIYAFAAPDDRGDLFAWAEGCGPIRRQGREVPPPSWPETLGPGDVVLLSQAADRRPECNLECTFPARCRSVPSIAYRLALAAVGEGVAAVSVNAPGAWDYAAGHALIGSVGGQLLDQTGRNVTYDDEGESYVRFCFGGAPGVVSELSRRPWSRLFVAPAPESSPDDLPFPVRLIHGRAVGDAGLLSRAHGCLLGQLCGDSLGGQVEFLGAGELRRRYPRGLREMEDGGAWEIMAGQPTDDSEMALMLARSLVARKGYDPEVVARAYGYWHVSGPFDEGNTTRRALGAIREGRSASAAARDAADGESQSNGSLMRVSPLGIYGHAMAPDNLAALARLDSALTHPHPACQESCALFAVAVARAVSRGGTPEELYGYVLEWAEADCRDRMVLNELKEAASGPPADYESRQGWVLVAFRNAFHQLLHAPGLEEGVVATVMAGGDTDTNAAIAGALLGALHGRGAVPEQWRRMVLSCRPARGVHATSHPRPQPFWPADSLELAELLVAISPSASS